MSAVRLCKLPTAYIDAKQEYFTACSKNYFKDYLSPWVPVEENKVTMIQKGELCIDDRGIEHLNGVGREFEVLVNGHIQKKSSAKFGSAQFVWVGKDTSKREAFLNGSIYKDYYNKYSFLLKEALINLYPSNGQQIYKKASFPIFHETDINGANNIKLNGFDCFKLRGRNSNEYGFAFYADPSFDRVKGKGNFKGAIIKIVPQNEENPPNLLNIYQFNSYINNLNAFLRHNIPSYMDATTSLYTWQIVCKELLVSGLYNGAVYLYEPYFDYKVESIITKY